MYKVINVFLFLGLSACWMPQTPSTTLASTSDDAPTVRKKAKYDSSSSSRSSSRLRTNSDDICSKFERCEEICDELFDYTREKKECYDLSFRYVGEIEEVIEALARPTARNLDRVSTSLFTQFSEYGLRTWERMIKGEYRENKKYRMGASYTPERAQDVLKWIIANPRVAESIDGSEVSAEILFYIFKALGNRINPPDDFTTADAGSPELRLRTGSEDAYRVGRVILSSISDPDPDIDLDIDYVKIFIDLENSKGSEHKGYTLFHNFLDDFCSDVNVVRADDTAISDSRKRCLSMLYFCRASSPSPSPSSDSLGGFRANNTPYGIYRYLINDTHQRTAESEVTTCGTSLRDFNGWSPYWRS